MRSHVRLAWLSSLVIALTVVGCSGDGGDDPADGGHATDAGTDGCTPTSWWPDDDHDGHGDAMASPISACVAPANHVDNADDCDDGESTTYPGADEICDGVDNDCDGTPDNSTECTITCDWTGARWLSHGWDGGNYALTGAWLSCTAGLVSDVSWVETAGIGLSPSAAGTADHLIGCDWTGTRWASEGIDGSGAFTNGAVFACDGTRLTSIAYEANILSDTGAAGNASCNWAGAVFLSHGWDGGCAFDMGLVLTCHNGRLTNVDQVEGSCGWSRY